MIAEAETKITRRLFTVEEYHQMAEVGILHEDDRIELIHGEIIQMSPIGKNHSAIVRRLNNLLKNYLESNILVDVQNPVLINEHSEPEPDIVILPFREDYYAETGVTPRDVLLLIEVSDSTLKYDRNTKLPLYATAGIPEVWIIDVNKKQLEAYRQPSGDRYQSVTTLTREDNISATQLSLNALVKELIG
ncbi:Uma2 family endonuclease [Tunicatimonas pelagia]|uniref:Uma2 family endonuclease n=1 Tax=Tunicatimonas pelagia TaxID=931531 RepID=UPI0026665BC3|nr:Uma2 family endonuclease [Tunicatimonas pelagia]WKN46256.1 Uma2 family endonuclease [Tunicatimonas pelagia]